MSINRLLKTASIGATALLLSVGAAFAVEAEATGSVNVRSGPGTGYAVLDQLRRGENVNIRGQRGGWCQVSKSGPDGWVSCRYLVAFGDFDDDDDFYDRDYRRPSVSIGFSFGTVQPRHHRRHWDDNDGPNWPNHMNDGYNWWD
jgi:uncharacterized protein YraI